MDPDVTLQATALCKPYDHLAFNYPLDDVKNSECSIECNSNSEYFTDDKMDDISKQISSNDPSLLNVNIRTMNKNFDSLKEFLHGTSVDLNIIDLLESRLKDKPHGYFHLDGYNLECANRQSDKGGGGVVCLFIKEELKYVVRNDLSKIKHPPNTETLFTEIERKNLRNIVIGVIYRSPDQDINEFNRFSDDILSKVTKNEN